MLGKDSSSRNNLLLIGGPLLVGLSGASVLFYYLFWKNRIRLYNDEIIIKALKTFKREYVPIYHKVADQCKNIRREFTKKGISQVTIKELKESLMENNPVLNNRISQLKQKVCIDLNLHEDSLFYSIQIRSDKNQSIKKLTEDLEDEFENAMLGNFPKVSHEAKISLCKPEQIFSFLENYNKWISLQMCTICKNKIKELKQFENFGLTMTLMMSVFEDIKNINVIDKKVEFLKKSGFGDDVDHPLTIYFSALDEYMKDKKFAKVVENIEANSDLVFRLMSSNKNIKIEDVENIEQKINEYNYKDTEEWIIYKSNL